jgi:hypothetical protein
VTIAAERYFQGETCGVPNRFRHIWHPQAAQYATGLLEVLLHSGHWFAMAHY